MNKKTIFTFLSVIVLIVGFIAFWYYRDKIFSKEILQLEILGPDTANVGDQIEYTVTYKNNGNFVLENPKLVFELPANSLTEDGKTRLTKDLEDIYPGNKDFVQFTTRLLGKEGDIKSARVWLSYIPKNLSVRYESDTTFTTRISTVPMTLTFDMPSKAEKGKEISYAINYFSNVDYPLENLSLKLDPTAGFNIKSADPTSLDNVEWKLPTLLKSEGGRVKIKGVVLADGGSNLSFSAKIGMWQDGIFVPIKEMTQDMEVISPLLSISQQINGSTNYVASPGERLHYEIFLRNTGITPLENLSVVVKPSSPAFDWATLTSGQGLVRRSDNSIAFDFNQVYQLRRLVPNQESKVEFDITLKENWKSSDAQKNNTILKNEVRVADIVQEFTTKVSAKLGLSQKAYFSNQQGIENSGPIPPEVNKTTTYTIAWQVNSYLNDVKNIKVKAILPQGITVSDNIVPESQVFRFVFDSQSREIVWSAGDLTANSSISIAFQIALTPTDYQKGNVINLIGNATVFAEDQITSATITATAPSVNTSLPDDSANSGGGIVQ